MTMSPPPLMRASLWRRHIFALAALALLGGCANGDFKEVRPILVHDDVHDWLDYDAIAGKNTSPSGFTLTDDERQLRDLAYPRIEQPYNRQQWHSVAGEYAAITADGSIAPPTPRICTVRATVRPRRAMRG
jgi:hypothetical protein